MGKITCAIKLDQFYLRKNNDSGGKDEPYLSAVYGEIDGKLLDSSVPPKDGSVTIHFPSNLGLRHAQLHSGGRAGLHGRGLHAGQQH